jgi:cyclopropane fatty-acyl-phospholipid synthase-like methyltransferase
MNKEFWNQRYGAEEYAYGEEPNAYFKEQLLKLKPGKILLPADGECRNGVFAARQGWEVHAFDLSEEARNKAMRLAQKHGVEVAFDVADLAHLELEAESFDVIALIFAHFPSDKKHDFHKKIVSWLKPGGTLIFEAFHKDHIRLSEENPKVGGPKNPDMLFDKAEVEQIFSNFEFSELNETLSELEEGQFHVGKSSLVRFTGIKSKE